VKQELARIYRDHRQGLFTLALSIVRNRDRAEDAVHEAFARLLRSGRQPTGDLVPYVFAAVRHAAIDQQRRGPAPTVSIYEGQGDGHVARPDDLAAGHERDRLLQQALEQLPEPQKQVIVMKLYADLTFDQIAEALGEPLPTVASRYRRALIRLRETVESFV
jgi:RNA polymerase sigma-70 factor (ECF subfamily)